MGCLSGLFHLVFLSVCHENCMLANTSYLGTADKTTMSAFATCPSNSCLIFFDSHHSGLFLFADCMKLEDVGLNPAMPCFRTEPADEAPKITYLHLYDCDKFSVSWFLLGSSPNSFMNLALILISVDPHCRLGSSACLHRLSFRYTITPEWQSSVNFYSGRCISSRMTGWSIHHLMPILPRVSFQSNPGFSLQWWYPFCHWRAI